MSKVDTFASERKPFPVDILLIRKQKGLDPDLSLKIDLAVPIDFKPLSSNSRVRVQFEIHAGMRRANSGDG